ncbi:MAE_28990/MAE_18760 family HEPN-like nuclease [Thalassospira tepidiphila]|uniref:RiboL-PSP-HEPN domain-containing protein n=2 Tax=Thalassospira tepidiphila TaxID=393657 RepID=A0A853KY85_9PROT|nr:MAE_28990/MAE_18760 family HEPN-like nuclease [Thalassospira tepidiphila]NJB75934.1 hypothetical protein [Thalassospira tepidiphila]OAZ08765.1 hypothetical protein TH4_15450 [Thalassospira tepidiphila MCCC 1A03514]
MGKKIRNLSQLQDKLDQELSWRIKEISYVKSAIRGSKELPKRTLLRAGVAILYSHWEGFIKNASVDYLNFINCTGETYSNLKDCFVFLGAKKHLNTLAETKKAEMGVASLNFLRDKLDEPVNINYELAIDTQSNLSSSVFENIAKTINVQLTFYQPYYNLIDESLLSKRNKIAHGETLNIEGKDWEKLSDEVIKLMRKYKTDIENNATLKDYII